MLLILSFLNKMIIYTSDENLKLAPSIIKIIKVLILFHLIIFNLNNFKLI